MAELPFLLLAGLILCTFFLVSFTSQKLRLPSVLIYIMLGALAALFFDKSDTVHVVGDIGIVLLFFILGLEFPLVRMVDISKKIWPVGLLDIFLNLGVAMGIALLFGLDSMSALVIGSVAYATSSSISGKMLEEQKRLANPETEFILALLIFEDLVAPILVSLIAGAQLGEEMSIRFVLMLLFKIILLMFGAIFLGLYGFKRLGAFISRHIQRDFMPLLTTGLALAYAGVAISLGLSEILGAFLAGVMLSETGKSTEVEHIILPIRDITLPFFFFWFGTTISFGEGISYMSMMLVLVVWAVVGKILTGFIGGRLYLLSKKVSVRAGFSFVPRGEFSAIIASLAFPQLRIFSGIYILITAFFGVFLFQKAPDASGWYFEKCCKKPEKKAVENLNI
jgi:monovalent cation:H+ antiporter-2, CPA2 family